MDSTREHLTFQLKMKTEYFNRCIELWERIYCSSLTTPQTPTLRQRLVILEQRLIDTLDFIDIVLSSFRGNSIGFTATVRRLVWAGSLFSSFPEAWRSAILPVP